jgi:hypothetical protein
MKLSVPLLFFVVFFVFNLNIFCSISTTGRQVVENGDGGCSTLLKSVEYVMHDTCCDMQVYHRRIRVFTATRRLTYK